MSRTINGAYEAGSLDTANLCCKFLNANGYGDACAALVAFLNDRADPIRKDADGAKQQQVEARLKGYTGDVCPECASVTMVRNGTCLKCENCGSTTGCS